MLLKLTLFLSNGGKEVAMMCPNSLVDLGKVIIIDEPVKVQSIGIFNHTHW